jgi:hypothetical protein
MIDFAPVLPKGKQIPTGDGSYIIVGKDGRPDSFIGERATAFFRNRMILLGLRMEVNTGMRLTRKAPKCSVIVKREFGLKGNPAKLLEQFEVIMKFLGDPKAQNLPVITRAQEVAG